MTERTDSSRKDKTGQPVDAGVWDSIADEDTPVPLSPEPRAELDRRLDAYDAQPEYLFTWDQVLERLRGRL